MFLLNVNIWQSKNTKLNFVYDLRQFTSIHVASIVNCLFWSLTFSFRFPASNTSTAQWTILCSHSNLNRTYYGLYMRSFDQAWVTCSLSDTSLNEVIWLKILLTSFVNVNLNLLDNNFGHKIPNSSLLSHPSLVVWKYSSKRL